MKYQFNLENFNGPLDLLIHLIDKDEMDILDIDFKKLTHQYLEFIKINTKKVSFDEFSEYLIFASSLLAIKSKKIIPLEKNEKLDLENDQYSAQELIKRLLEYKKIKKSIDDLKIKASQRRKFLKIANNSLSEFITKKEITKKAEHDANFLILEMNRIIERFNLTRDIKTSIEKDQESYEKIEKEITSKINILKKEFVFEDLLIRNNKKYIVTAFFILLTKISLGEIKIWQSDNFSKIKIQKVVN